MLPVSKMRAALAAALPLAYFTLATAAFSQPLPVPRPDRGPDHGAVQAAAQAARTGARTATQTAVPVIRKDLPTTRRAMSGLPLRAVGTSVLAARAGESEVARNTR